MTGNPSVTAWIWGLLAEPRLRNAAVIVGVFVAVVSIRSARMLARKKQSADLLFASKKDDGLQLGYSEILAYHDGADNMRLLATTKRDCDSAKHFRYLLNHFESLCVGIRAKIYDENMVQETWHSVMTETYEKSLPFILAMRQAHGKPATYDAFECIAKRWIKRPLKPYPTTIRGKLWYWVVH